MALIFEPFLAAESVPVTVSRATLTPAKIAPALASPPRPAAPEDVAPPVPASATLGTQDGGWNDVLRRAVFDAVAYTPPSSSTAGGTLTVRGTDIDDVISVTTKRVNKKWRVFVTINGRVERASKGAMQSKS